MPSRVAIIAGAGRFPFAVAREAKRQGLQVVAVGIQGWADPALRAEVDAYDELPLGQIGRLMERLKAHQIQQAVMAGKVTKQVLLGPRAGFDLEALALLTAAKDMSVPSLLGAVAQRMAREGITLLDSSTFLQANLCPSGALTARRPTAAESADVDAGVRAARALAAADIGQTVIVKGGVVVAVEALEGTDAAIRRAHALAQDGLVVVKTASATQDRRFDLPIIGLETLVVCRDSGVSCLAVEAGATLLLDREQLLERANAAGMCLLGVDVPAGRA